MYVNSSSIYFYVFKNHMNKHVLNNYRLIRETQLCLFHLKFNFIKGMALETYINIHLKILNFKNPVL